MEPTSRRKRSSSRTLLRYAPFVGVVLVIVIVGLLDQGQRQRRQLLEASDSERADERARSCSRPRTRRRSTGDRSATRHAGTVAVPLTYAPPCVKPFTGNNGGATAPGVTGDTITIALYQTQPDILQQTFFQQSGSDESLAAELADRAAVRRRSSRRTTRRTAGT